MTTLSCFQLVSQVDETCGSFLFVGLFVRYAFHSLSLSEQSIKVGKLTLMDLAGSERASNTQNRGIRMVEGTA